jgi:hypothetical protein
LHGLFPASDVPVVIAAKTDSPKGFGPINAMFIHQRPDAMNHLDHRLHALDQCMSTMAPTSSPIQPRPTRCACDNEACA